MAPPIVMSFNCKLLSVIWVFCHQYLDEMLEALESGFLGLTPVNHGWILRERIGMEVDLQQQCFIDEIGTSLFGEVDSPSKNDED